MKPEDVLDLKADLISRLYGMEYSRYMAAFTAARFQPDLGADLTPDAVAEGARWCVGEAGALHRADNYFVSADMLPLIDHAADLLDESDSFLESWWPSSHGFLVFETAMLLEDVWGRDVCVKAASWEPARNGHRFSTYVDRDDPRDFYNRSEDSPGGWTIGKLHVLGIGSVVADSRVGPPRISVGDKYTATFGPNVGMEQNDDAVNMQRRFLALFMLMQQKITAVADGPISRPARRRAERRKQSPRVVVADLRHRHEAGPARGGSIDWTHQWVVHGDWQWRKCGPMHPNATSYERGHRARVWIGDFIKGPPDLPLVIKDRVGVVKP